MPKNKVQYNQIISSYRVKWSTPDFINNVLIKEISSEACLKDTHESAVIEWGYSLLN